MDIYKLFDDIPISGNGNYSFYNMTFPFMCL